MKPALAAALGCCALLSAGCAGHLQVGTPSGRPDCPGADGRVGDPLVLVAQSVPTAQWLPCLRTLPVGWSFRRLEAQSGRTQLTLGASDADGDHQVLVLLQHSCDVAGAAEADSRQPGVRRYDRLPPQSAGYRADRYYVFSGGCVTEHLDLHGRANAEGANVVTAGLGMVPRSAVSDAYRHRSNGRIPLDPDDDR